jgi:hypothetical protein
LVKETLTAGFVDQYPTPWSLVSAGFWGGTVSTLRCARGGLGSPLPEGSNARTLNVWPPWERPVRASGEVQAVYGASSSEHLNVDGTWSLDVNVKVADVVGWKYAVGPVRVVSGAWVSTNSARISMSCQTWNWQIPPV